MSVNSETSWATVSVAVSTVDGIAAILAIAIAIGLLLRLWRSTSAGIDRGQEKPSRSAFGRWTESVAELDRPVAFLDAFVIVGLLIFIVAIRAFDIEREVALAVILIGFCYLAARVSWYSASRD